jgi:hypothetical protein
VNRDRFATISPSRIGRTCHSLIGIMKSKRSRRIVPITRSQKAFACGARTGVFRVPRPIASSVRSTRLQPSVSRPRTSLRLGALAHPAGPGGPPHLLRWAQRMAAPMNGANSPENPAGVPRFRKVIRVAPTRPVPTCPSSPSETDLPQPASPVDGRERTPRFHSCAPCCGRETLMLCGVADPATLHPEGSPLKCKREPATWPRTASGSRATRLSSFAFATSSRTPTSGCSSS